MSNRMLAFITVLFTFGVLMVAVGMVAFIRAVEVMVHAL